MSLTEAVPLSARSAGVSVSRRSLASFVRAVVRNPVEALPPETFHVPLVYHKLAGHVRLYLCDPALIHEALVRNAAALTKSDIARRVLTPMLGEGLLTAEHGSWRWQRQSAAPAFQHGKLMAFLPAMIDAATGTAARWRAAGPGATLDINHEMMATTFAIIVETMLSGSGGLDVARVERDITTYLDTVGWSAALGVLGAPDWVPYPGRRRARAAAAGLKRRVEAMVAGRRAGPERADLVSLLLGAADPETGRRMTDREIADNLLTFITAGHETTAQGLTWTLHLLTRHPDIEDRMLAEIAAVTGGAPLQPAHVADLAYTRQVFSEAMRLYPPAPLVTRKVEQDFRLGDTLVPAGTTLVIPTYAVHRQARLWPDPERFDPARFAPDAVKGRHRFSYLPFGAGPRICIGSAFAVMEAVAILATLVPAFRFTRRDAHVPVATMKITLRPDRPLRMGVSPR